LIQILHDIKAHFGDDFILSITPEFPYVQGGAIAWGTGGTPGSGHYGGYLALLNNIRDIVTYVAIQYYNNYTGGGYVSIIGQPSPDGDSYYPETLTKLSQMLINGFDVYGDHGHFDGYPPEKVVICVLLSDEEGGYGTQSLDNYEEALSYMLNEYPTFRGIATWSIQIQLREADYGADIFANEMHEYVIDPLNAEENEDEE
jgi:chitinase